MELFSYLGIGTLSLVIYIIVVISVNTVLKRPISEAMFAAMVVLLGISAVAGHNPAIMLVQGVAIALQQEALFAAMAFVFMAYMMERTKIVARLVLILNSLLGRLAGGAGYVSTLASALFGMVSGSGTGNASTVGSITIPWMEETGWSKEAATTVVAGNAGLGMVFPPSSSMFLLLGMPAIAAELTSSQLYITVMGVALIVLAYRLLLVFYYVHKYGIKAVPSDTRQNLGQTFQENRISLTLFIGIAVPILLTMGPIAGWLEAQPGFGAEGVDSISLLIWIPILTTIVVIITGWKYLPHSAKGWYELAGQAVSKYREIGMMCICAFAASYIFIRLGLEKEVAAVFGVLGSTSSLLVILCIALLTSMMVGPFTGTATTTALGSVAYLALRSVGVSPAVACTAFLILVSNEGCIPPNSGPIFIASGISGLDKPSTIYSPLILHYAIPTVLIAVLVAAGIIPTLG